MDTATLILSNAVLRLGSIRAAARALERPAATVAAAVARLEAALAVELVRRTGSSLMLTLEGARLLPRIEALCGLSLGLYRGGEQRLSPAAVSLEALSRLNQVARSGSIRAAAREMGLGQPQLTRQIAHVEGVLGYAIFERGRDCARLTPAGVAAVERIRQIETLWREIADAASDRFRRTETVVRIGSVVPLGPESRIADLLADLAANWRSRHPRQPIFIGSMIAEELLTSLKRGLFDVVFLDVERLPEDLEGHLISVSPLTLVGPADQLKDLSGDDRAGLATLLATHPIALPSPRSGLRQKIDPLLEALFGRDGRRAPEIVEVDSIPVILKLVTRHRFVSVLPGASLAALDPAVARLELGPDFSLPLWIAWPRGRAGDSIQRQVLALLRK